MPDTLRINGQRLWHSLMELAQIGATDKGGVKRLALTDLDRQGRDLVVGWAREAGMSVSVYKIGNVFMRRAGRDDLPGARTGQFDDQPVVVAEEGEDLAGHPQAGAAEHRPDLHVGGAQELCGELVEQRACRSRRVTHVLDRIGR